MSFYTEKEISDFGFLSVGCNVKISRKCSIYGANKITIGDNVRIDDFCLLSSGNEGMKIGCYVHIAAYSSLIGSEKITLEDFSGLSSRVSIYSSSDDYSGKYLTNPTVPKKLTGVRNGPVLLKKHVIIGAGSIILPNVTLEEGAAVGSLSLVNQNCSAFGIYAGNPARFIKERKCDLLILEAQLLAELKNEK